MDDIITNNTCQNHRRATPNERGAACRGRIYWLWFPSLLAGDGMLAAVVMLSLIMLRRFGLNNAQATLYMSLVCLPLLARPLMEMVVTMFRGTTKVWVLSAEFVSAMALWAVAFLLPTQYWLQALTCFMPVVVAAGMFYNIAVERFYTDTCHTVARNKEQIATLARCVALMAGFGVTTMLAGNMEVVTRNVRYSWSMAMYVMAGVEFALWLWHSIFLPGAGRRCAADKDLYGLARGEYANAADSMARGLSNRFMLYFAIAYCAPMALLATMPPLFMIDAPHNGGLGLAPQEIGLTMGTIGSAALFVGLTAAGAAIRKLGLRCCMLPITIMAAGYSAAMLYLSYNPASSLAVVASVCLGAFLTLGMGARALDEATSRFAARQRGAVLRKAVTRSLMALTVTAGSMFAGLLQTNIGYRQLFIASTAAFGVPVAMAVIHTIIYKE